MKIIGKRKEILNLKSKVMLFVISAFWGALLIASLPSLAQEKIEGKVIKTNLTACSVVPGKVGTCEGTLILESKKDGKPVQTTIQITRDTVLKRGDEKVFLFQLQGAAVTVTFSEDKGEKLVRSVVTKGQ